MSRHPQHNILINYLSDWEEYQDNGIYKIRKTFYNQSYQEGLQKTQEIGKMSEALNHHPIIQLEYKSLTVTWWSHDISGISLRDFMSAGATDNIYSFGTFNGDYFKCPSQKYIPGKNTKPESHMAFYHLLSTDLSTNAKEAQRHPSFLFAVQLFNQGYYWETHEVLEDLWNKTGRTSDIAQLFQSIIFLAAGNLKRIINNQKSAQKHYESALRKMPKNCDKLIGLNYEKFMSDINTQMNTEDVIKFTFL